MAELVEVGVPLLQLIVGQTLGQRSYSFANEHVNAQNAMLNVEYRCKLLVLLDVVEAELVERALVETGEDVVEDEEVALVGEVEDDA